GDRGLLDEGGEQVRVDVEVVDEGVADVRVRDRSEEGEGRAVTPVPHGEEAARRLKQVLQNPRRLVQQRRQRLDDVILLRKEARRQGHRGREEQPQQTAGAPPGSSSRSGGTPSILSSSRKMVRGSTPSARAVLARLPPWRFRASST